MKKETITIKGNPNSTVKIFPRTHTDPPPEPVFVGELDSSGQLSVEIPHGYFVVLSPGCDTAILNVPQVVVLENAA